ncbi:cyclohexyl-isocyanide hydratase [Faunimonas pinastri]|uniref:Cyclohexyl-isocyanide hydratase n=1 Tax=Faunimonas pinastri TaxID=1855383 RepID=A0A1H9HVZ6_9HYPH|nr:DJ-1/PfpI family protein [Faunimonas pinastri]SEQ66458.1 cyclohexyl-isocyanide hydratase [Faunimonas pinastri]
MTIRIGFLVFPRVQQLDLTGPYDVFGSLPDRELHLIWKSREPVASSSGMWLTPDTSFEDCPELDVLCIPGGSGVSALMQDAEVLAFVRETAAKARYVTSVCTGSLVLGAAGLLKGRRATTHWASHHLLPLLGAVPVKERIVRDGNLITGGGVTAGIDFALAVVAELTDRAQAEAIQLGIEYAPAPPFDAGSPETAPAGVLEQVRASYAETIRQRGETIAMLGL